MLGCLVDRTPACSSAAKPIADAMTARATPDTAPTGSGPRADRRCQMLRQTDDPPTTRAPSEGKPGRSQAEVARRRHHGNDQRCERLRTASSVATSDSLIIPRLRSTSKASQRRAPGPRSDCPRAGRRAPAGPRRTRTSSAASTPISSSRRRPSRSRRRWSTTSIAEASCACTASRAGPAATPSASNRAGRSARSWRARCCMTLRGRCSSPPAGRRPPRRVPRRRRDGQDASAGLSHQGAESDLACALDVGTSRLEADHMRVSRTQLVRVLDEDDALVRVDQRQQGVQQTSSCHSRCRR